MLVLSRKLEEEIFLGENISIKIIDISKNEIKLGIEAPKDVVILRGELKKRIEASNKEAANSDVASAKELSKLLKK